MWARLGFLCYAIEAGLVLWALWACYRLHQWVLMLCVVACSTCIGYITWYIFHSALSRYGEQAVKCGDILFDDYYMIAHRYHRPIKARLVCGTQGALIGIGWSGVFIPRGQAHALGAGTSIVRLKTSTGERWRVEGLDSGEQKILLSIAHGR